jgi:uncharacterized protein YggL (DUF469 family)
MHKKAARSRRLRKKLYEGEFSEFGFVIDFTIEDGVEDHFDAFMDGFIDLIESRGLSTGGGLNGVANTGGFFVCSSSRYGSATEDDRKAIEAWVSRERQALGITNLWVGPLQNSRT